MSDVVRIVLDDTAMAAAGRGNVLASRLLHRAHAQAGWYLYAPACALVEADRDRAGTAEHLAALFGITVLVSGRRRTASTPPSRLRPAQTARSSPPPHQSSGSGAGPCPGPDALTEPTAPGEAARRRRASRARSPSCSMARWPGRAWNVSAAGGSVLDQ